MYDQCLVDPRALVITPICYDSNLHSVSYFARPAGPLSIPDLYRFLTHLMRMLRGRSRRFLSICQYEADSQGNTKQQQDLHVRMFCTYQQYTMIRINNRDWGTSAVLGKTWLKYMNRLSN